MYLFDNEDKIWMKRIKAVKRNIHVTLSFISQILANLLVPKTDLTFFFLYKTDVKLIV